MDYQYATEQTFVPTLDSFIAIPAPSNVANYAELTWFRVSDTCAVSGSIAAPSGFTPQVNTSGKYGNFSVTSEGAWNYLSTSSMLELPSFYLFTDQFYVVSLSSEITAVSIHISTDTANFSESTEIIATAIRTNTGNINVVLQAPITGQALLAENSLTSNWGYL